MIAYRQPPNILRYVTKAAFTSQPPTISTTQRNGLFKCNNVRCKLCSLYIQECTSFKTYNGYEWQIRCPINCNSVNVLYYLKCTWCNVETTYTGKTNNMRLRINNHITACRHGDSTDKFDIHVYQCRQKHENSNEPFFEIYAFLTVNNEQSLLTYEDYLHKRGFHSMNKPK